MSDNLINLKCIDDYNNKIGLMLQKNINNLFTMINIDYNIKIEESNFFENIQKKFENKTPDYSKDDNNLYDPYK